MDSTLYHLRLKLDNFPQFFLDTYVQLDEPWLLVAHNDKVPEKKHYHCMFNSKYTNQGIRSYLKKLKLGNKGYSLKKGTSLGFQYICHENSTYLQGYGVNYDVLHRASKEYCDNKKKPKNESLYNIMEKYHEKIVDAISKDDNVDYVRSMTRMVLQHYSDLKRPMSAKFHYQNVLRSFLYKIDNSYARYIRDYYIADLFGYTRD